MSSDPTAYIVGSNVSGGISWAFNAVSKSPIGSAVKSAFNMAADYAGMGVDYTTGFFSTFMPKDYAKVASSLATLGAAAYFSSGKNIFAKVAIMGMAVAGIAHSTDMIDPKSPMGELGNFLFGNYTDLYSKYSGGPQSNMHLLPTRNIV